MTNKTQRYIPEILEDILEELKRLNGENIASEVETRPLTEDKPKRGRKPFSKILGFE